MSPLTPQRRRRARIGALVAVLAGGSSAFTGLARHLIHPAAQPMWHWIFDIAFITLMMFLLVLLALEGAGACRPGPR